MDKPRDFNKNKLANNDGRHRGRKSERKKAAKRSSGAIGLQRDAKEQEIASSLPADLDSLPRLKGFRLRGMEMTRLETFIDAAFAFAVTILIYVYPLKLLFGGMFYFLSGHVLGQLVTANTAGQVRALFAIYGLGFAAIALEILLLNLRAWRLREPLRLNEHEKSLTRGEIIGWSVPATVGRVSFVLALTLPMKHIGWSGWVYLTLSFLVPLQRTWHARRRAAEAAKRG